MSSIQPQPLSSSSRANRIPESIENAEVKKKHRTVDSLNQRQQRAEEEGLVDSLRRKLVATEKKLADANRELEQTRAGRGATPISSLETRFDELVQKYKSAKEKHSMEIARLRSENEQLSASASSTSSSRPDDAAVRDLRKAHALAEAENSKLRRELSISKEWGSQRASMMQEVSNLKAQLAERQEAHVPNNHREVQLEQILEDSAEAFARLHMSTVGRGVYEQTRSQLREVRGSVLALQSQVGEMEVQMREATGGLEVVIAQARREKDERKMLQKMVDQLLAERNADRALNHSAPILDSVEPLEPIDQTSAATDLVLNHAALVSDHLSSLLYATQDERDDLRSALSSTSSTLSSTQTELSNLRVAHTSLTNDHAAVVASHKDCASHAAELREDVLRAEQAAARSDVEAREARDEVARAEARAASDREALKRGNDAGVRWKSAKASMEEETNSLREALREAYTYEEQYRALAAEYDELASREAMASREVEKIGQQNAELIGHQNGDQRINYVESLRREMALVKQELASTRQMLNVANERKAELEQEVAAYKSIDAPLIPELAQSTRTRVVRRAPEGSRLVSSTRSVSGRK